jgi:hypothetical protein
MQESMKLALVESNGIVGKRPVVGSRLGKRADRARFWPAVLISMIVVPMLVVLGFYATISAQAAGPAPVDLLSAGNYVILGNTGITNTGITTSITGDIGTSSSATSITGFDLVLDASGTFSTSVPSSLVTGRVYAFDYTDPTPAEMTAASNDMLTAFGNAAGLPADGDKNNLWSGDLTGQNLAPGTYVWASAVSVAAAGSVTISGTSSDVWVFQITGVLSLGSGASVILNGAVAEHIFWQVAGSVVLDTTSSMKGIILCSTDIAMNNGATLEGRALAQTAVTLDGNIIYGPGVTPIPEFSQVLIPLVGMLFVVAIVSKVRNQKK